MQLKNDESLGRHGALHPGSGMIFNSVNHLRLSNLTDYSLTSGESGYETRTTEDDKTMSPFHLALWSSAVWCCFWTVLCPVWQDIEQHFNW